MKSTRTALRAGALVVVLVAAVLAAPSRDKVYFGNVRNYSKPAEVNARKVFMDIRAYRDIVDQGIPKDSARYLLQLQKANQVFKDAVKACAEQNGYDLICEEGTLDSAPDVTTDVINSIPDDQRV